MFSFWEHQQYPFGQATLVVGAGITGLSTALELKKRDAKHPVIVLDRMWPPRGASTKNAGFVCYGSLSEIVSDLKSMSEQACIDLIRMRWQGSLLLAQRLGKKAIDYSGGFELFDPSQLPNEQEIRLGNALFEAATGEKNYFQLIPNLHFPTFDSTLLHLPREGSLDTGCMMDRLHTLCREQGVLFLFGVEVTGVGFTDKTLLLADGNTIPFKRCAICTNGFTHPILSTPLVKAVRNQLLVTNPLPHIPWQGVYHYQEGYYYFRRIGNRILLGGARNLDPETETTDQFAPNHKIINHLDQFMRTRIPGAESAVIDYQWSGILGVGDDKFPFVQQLAPGVIAGVKLGGMGVAIGSKLGQDIVQMLLEEA